MRITINDAPQLNYLDANGIPLHMAIISNSMIELSSLKPEVDTTLNLEVANVNAPSLFEVYNNDLNCESEDCIDSHNFGGSYVVQAFGKFAKFTPFSEFKKSFIPDLSGFMDGIIEVAPRFEKCYNTYSEEQKNSLFLKEKEYYKFRYEMKNKDECKITDKLPYTSSDIRGLQSAFPQPTPNEFQETECYKLCLKKAEEHKVNVKDLNGACGLLWKYNGIAVDLMREADKAEEEIKRNKATLKNHDAVDGLRLIALYDTYMNRTLRELYRYCSEELDEMVENHSSKADVRIEIVNKYSEICFKRMRETLKERRRARF